MPTRNYFWQFRGAICALPRRRELAWAFKSGGRRAVDLLRVEKDAIGGSRIIVCLGQNRCLGWRQEFVAPEKPPRNSFDFAS